MSLSHAARVAPYLSRVMENWCKYFLIVDDEYEKLTSMSGILNAVLINQEFNFISLAHCITSFVGDDRLETQMKQVVSGYKQTAVWQTVPESMRSLLITRFKLQ